MGKWNLLDIKSSYNLLDGDNRWGTNLKVTLRLLYKPKLLGKFVEPPLLDWYETIITLDHVNKEYWVWHGNLYKINPTSNTLKAWCLRWPIAYGFATKAPFYLSKGYVKLYTKNGFQLKGGQIKAGLSNPVKKTEAVRKYLQKNGGILEVQIHDIPSFGISKSRIKNEERLLNFNCGIVGNPMKFQGQQYLKMFSSEPKNTWISEFTPGWPKSIKTTGFRKIPHIKKDRSNVLKPGDGEVL